MTPPSPAERAGRWTGRLSRLAGGACLFLAASGLIITFGPFHPVVQWALVVHTVAGALVAVPLIVYTVRHWTQYRRFQVSHIVLLGYVAGLALLPGQCELHRGAAARVPVAVAAAGRRARGPRLPDSHLSRRAPAAQQAAVQDAGVLRRVPQAVHRRRSEQRRLGAAAEPVRQLGKQPLELEGGSKEDDRMPRVPHAARGLEARLDAVCATNPRAAGGWFLLGYVHGKRGDLTGAAALLGRARASLGPDWKPRGATAEGDVSRQAHEDLTPLSRFLEGWNGSERPAEAYAELDRFLAGQPR